MVKYNNEKNIEDDSTEKSFGTLVFRTDFLCTINASTATGKWNRSEERCKVWRNSL
jgi:hypothetical protein